MPSSNAIVDVNGGLGQLKALLAKHAKGLSVVHFWADWAEQCGPMDEALKILVGEDTLSSVQFLRVEAETEADISMELEVAAVPTLLFFGPKGKKVLDRVEGAKVADVTKKVRELKDKVAMDLKTDNLKRLANEAAEEEKGALDINDRLKALINAKPVMLFMKGSPEAPECGFSRQTVSLLSSLDADYGHFDILRDNEVRQGLKEFSKWPTYPQLYVKGDLIGGLDILKEMHEQGELKDLLPKKVDLQQRLKELVKKSDVMVFMKGNPSEPKCGFSRTLISILQPLNIKFETFDILEDEDVRQGLKTFSNWPTFPQVYVKGELIGGLDIIKELQENGELAETLKA